jgi:hypothetical protein
MTSMKFFERKGKVVRVCLGTLWFVAIGIGLVACKPGGAPPPPGKVNLEYVETSKSEVIFILANGSSKTLSIRGRRTLSLGVQPWTSDTGIECETIPSKGSEEDPIGLGDGNPVIFKISPGEQVRLTIPTTLPQRFKGGHCRLSLLLQDGRIIGPTDFQP